MNHINNYDLILPLLDFKSKDVFYYIQIIKRKKEHPELGSNNIVIKDYHITSIDYLDMKMPEIKALCDMHNARAYINVIAKSFEKAAYHLLRKVSEQILNKEFKACRRSYESICGLSATNTGDKRWIIDIDSKEPQEYFDKMIAEINAIEPIGPKLLVHLPTKNGSHLIVKPFNIAKFKRSGIDIHKNNPTILYCLK